MDEQLAIVDSSNDCLYCDIDQEVAFCMHEHQLRRFCIPAAFNALFTDRAPCALTTNAQAQSLVLPARGRNTTDRIFLLSSKLCTITNLMVQCQQKLGALCHKYDDIFNDGIKSLAKTARFKVELRDA